MGGLSRLYRGESEIDFPRLWKWGYVISALLVVVGSLALVTQGLNLSIDFEGGSVWEVPSEDVSADDVRAVLEEGGNAAGSKIQLVTDPTTGASYWRVQASVDNVEESLEVARQLAEAAGVPTDEISTNTVGPSWGSSITDKAVRALLIFLVLISGYIAWRLEWRMAVGALAAMAHDLVITVGLYAVTGWEVTPATVIAFLTILGYSLYDTIVVYDKVAEDIKKPRFQRMPFTDLMNSALNQVLMRSLNTTIITVVPLFSLLVVGSFVMDQPVLSEFSIALLAGLLVGAYSSIFIASPIVAALKEREPHYRRLRARAEGDDTFPSRRDPVGVGGGASAPKALSGKGQAKRPPTKRSATSGSGVAADTDATGSGPADDDNPPTDDAPPAGPAGDPPAGGGTRPGGRTTGGSPSTLTTGLGHAPRPRKPRKRR